MILKTSAFHFSVDRKQFENEALEKKEITIIMIFPLLSFPKKQIQNGR